MLGGPRQPGDPLAPKPGAVRVWVPHFRVWRFFVGFFAFLPGQSGPVRTLPHLSLVGPSSRENANPFLYMQIFAADLRASGAVGKKSLFKKPLFK